MSPCALFKIQTPSSVPYFLKDDENAEAMVTAMHMPLPLSTQVESRDFSVAHLPGRTVAVMALDRRCIVPVSETSTLTSLDEVPKIQQQLCRALVRDGLMSASEAAASTKTVTVAQYCFDDNDDRVSKSAEIWIDLNEQTWMQK